MIVDREFYEKAVFYQRKYSDGILYKNDIQTNGTLIDSKWIEFFSKHDFDVSVSIDGPKSIHDTNRIYPDGQGSFDDVIRGIRLVKNAGLSVGVCVVISKSNVHVVDEIYDFLVTEKLNFNVIPINKSGGVLDNDDKFCLNPHELAEPWIKMYDRWFDAPSENYVYCSDFAHRTCSIISGQTKHCNTKKCCSETVVSMDCWGYVYPCAVLSSDAEWRYGNINDNSLDELLQGDVGVKTLNRSTMDKCSRCRWNYACNGGCMGRAIKYNDDLNTRDYFCPSLHRIYDHIAKRYCEYSGKDISELPCITNEGQNEITRAIPQ